MGQAREAMDRLTAVFTGDKNLDALGQCYAQDAIVYTPDVGEIRGREAIVKWWSEMIEAVPNSTYERVHAHESGDTAIDEGFYSGVNDGPLTMPTGEKLPATHNKFRLRSADFATARNGQIVEHRLYYDQMEFLTQLGLGQP